MKDATHNRLMQYRKAAQFFEFSLKLLQIRAAETYSRLVVPSSLYRTPGLPRDIVIRVSEKCFLHCKFCAQGGEKGRVDQKHLSAPPIDTPTFRKIMDETAAWRIKPFIKITGGEPLVMGHTLLDALEEMRGRGFVVKLNTNGMLLKNKRIARRIVDLDLNYLSISLDGGREVHNELRGQPKLFDAIMEGIDNIREYRMSSGRKNPMILVSMCISSQTQDQIEEVYRITCDKRIDWFNIQFLNYTTPQTCEDAHAYAQEHLGVRETPWEAFCNPHFNDIDPALIVGQIQAILARRGPVPVSVMGGLSSADDISRYYFSLDPIRSNICYLPFTGMHIVPPGKAVFCIDYPFYEYGDIRHERLADAWYGEKAQRFRVHMRRYYQEHRLNLPQCQRCNWRFN